MLYRSRLEFKVGGWLSELRATGFRPNYVVHEAGGVEADFAWPSHRVVLEVSPFYTHGSEVKQRRDIIRRRKLLAAGWLVFEVTDADLVSIHTFATAIDHLLQTLRSTRVS
jgi:very-short-patch-repair endonuclease